MQSSTTFVRVGEEKGHLVYSVGGSLPDSLKDELRSDNPGAFFRGAKMFVPKPEEGLPDGDAIAVQLLGGGAYRLTCAIEHMDQIIADHPAARIHREEDGLVVQFNPAVTKVA